MPTPHRHANQATPAPRDRRTRDGEAGRGDMLGGLNAGVGDQLGLPEDDAFDAEAAPTSGFQHDLDEGSASTDAARNYHGRDEPA